MAAGDIALKLMITGSADGAIAAMSGLSGAAKGAGTAFKLLGSSLEQMKLGGMASGMAGFKAGLQDLGKSFLEIGAIATLAGVAIAVAIGIKAVKAAGDFQVQMTKLYTTAGETKANLKMVGDGILAMSGQVGTGAKELGDGIYWIESAGLHGQKALDALRVAAQAAKAENANLDDVSRALGASLNAYAGYGLTDASVMNTLTAATGQGMMTMGQLAASLKNVLPVSATFGISLTDVTAALATMTSQGDDAASAATHLSQMIRALEAPSKIGAKALASVGLSSQQIADEMRKSLPGAVQMITDAVGKKFPAGSAAYNNAIKDIAGGNKQMMGFLELSGKHLATFNDNVVKITGAVKAGGNSIMGWSDIQKNFNFQMDSAKASLGAFMIQLGTKLMPIFSQLMTLLIPLIMGFLNWAMNSGILQGILQTLVNVLTFLVNTGTAVVNFFQTNEIAMAALKATLIVLAVIIGVAMVMALYSMAAAAWAAMIPFLPIIAVIALIIVVVTAVILIVQHWGEIAHWLQGVWAPVGAFLTGLWNGIKSVAVTVWTAISNFFMGVFKPVAAFFQAGWNQLLAMLTATWNVIKTVAFVIFSIIVALIILPFLPLINWFKAHWEQIHAVITTVWNVIKEAAIFIWNTIVNSIMTPINAIKSWLTGAWNFISAAARVAWGVVSVLASSIWNSIVNAIKGPITAAQTWLSGAWDNIKKAFSNVMGSLAGIAKGAWDNVSGVVKNAINFLITLIDNIIGGINNVTGAVGIPPIPMIPHFAAGTNFAPGGMAIVGERGPEMVYLPRGSQVVPNNQLSSRGSFAVGGSGSTTQHIHVHPAPVYLDKRQVGEILFNYQASEIRKQGGVKR